MEHLYRFDYTRNAWLDSEHSTCRGLSARPWDLIDRCMSRLTGMWAFVAMAFVAATLAASFKLLPATAALIASAYDAHTVGRWGSFVGVQNYLELLRDEQFWHSVEVSLCYACGVVAGSLAIGMWLAAALRRKSALADILCVGFMLPILMPGVVAATVWRWLLDPYFGEVDRLLRPVGLGGYAWLQDPHLALGALIAVGTWKEMGLAMAILLASLRRVPVELEEAATLDGGGALVRWLHILLPLLRPAVALVVLTSLIQSMETFTPYLVLTGGGPAGATQGWTLDLYRTGFETLRLGYGSAMAVLVGGLLVPILALSWSYMRRQWAAAA